MSKNKVITDKQLIEKFLSKGVDTILPSKEGLREKLLSGKRLTAYMGFDPTGPYLHVGHGMGIRALRILQQLGHRVIFLIGDYTARVGDPDKDKTRDLLTTEQIEKNMSGWKDQASQLIDFEDKVNPVEFAHNYTWLHKLDLEKLIELMSHMTVQQMMERELFSKRLNDNNPIRLQEFIYPLMQGYDSVAMEVDLELGGTDQIFNMMVGRDLVQAYLGKEKFVRAQEMMPAADGIQMSKTRGNGINLADTSEDIYGKAMSYSDEHIITGLKLLTETTDEEISEIENAIKNGENPMQFKKLFAFRTVEVVRGTEEARKAQDYFESTVQNKDSIGEAKKINFQDLSKNGNTSDPIYLISSLMQSSNSDARRLLDQNAVEINGTKVKYYKGASIDINKGDTVKIGKRNWFELV